MPTIITTPSWTTKFSLNTTPKKFIFVDSTDYTTPSIPLTGVRGVFEITTPSGVVVYNNTSYGAGSDIVANVSLTNAITIALPNLSNQAPEQGIYTITYTVRIIDGVNPTYYITATDTFNFVYDSPTVSIVPQVDCIQPLITVADDTDYVVENITPTNTRTFTLQYPANSGGTTITNTTSDVITSGTLYNGMQVATVSSILSYAYSNFTVADTVTGTKSINVDCSFICQLYCCLRSLNNRMEAVRYSNNILFEQYSTQMSQVMAKVELLFLAIDCGKQEDANDLIATIKSFADCTDDCSCTDGTPSRVTGLGIQNVNVVVQSGGAPITVTGNTSGGITTYTVTFSAALVTQLSTMYNTVVTNSDGTITVVDSGIISGTRTYTISSAVATPKDSMWFRLLVTFTSTTTVTTGGTNWQIEGTNMNVTATITDVSIPGGNNLFKVDNFLITPNNNYKVWIENVQLTTATAFASYTQAQQYLSAQICDVRVLDLKSGEFYFQFVNPSGVPLTLAAIYGNGFFNGIRTAILNILIKK